MGGAVETLAPEEAIQPTEVKHKRGGVLEPHLSRSVAGDNPSRSRSRGFDAIESASRGHAARFRDLVILGLGWVGVGGRRRPEEEDRGGRGPARQPDSD